MRLFGIVGYKNSGKTRLVVELISHLRSLGTRVATIKHAHHDFEIDHPGKDSFLHREAGACEVLVVSSKRWAHITELESDGEPPLEHLLERIERADLILIEGYKTGSHPMLEVRRPQLGHAPLDDHPHVIAIVSDDSIADSKHRVFSPKQVSEIAAFILEHAATITPHDRER